jgi:hypothetical protein
MWGRVGKSPHLLSALGELGLLNRCRPLAGDVAWCGEIPTSDRSLRAAVLLAHDREILEPATEGGRAGMLRSVAAASLKPHHPRGVC